MAPKQPSTGLFVGLNKGHVVTRKELPPRPSDRKGVGKDKRALKVAKRKLGTHNAQRRRERRCPMFSGR
ncbi:60S ribosomal protein L36 [Spatholobus suberectus]|nr:60S ribosomal protein L36 [Spatholobus suberectus]